MIPIYEQGHGSGIGHSEHSFAKLFISICKDHLTTGRAKNFAFIFRDFEDRRLNLLLKDEGVFSKLDRLSGTDMSIFYLHHSAHRRSKDFNHTFLDLLGFPEPDQMPCVVFFNLRNGAISGQEIAYLDTSNPHISFHELYELIELHKAGVPSPAPKFSAVKTVRAVVKFVGREALSALIEGGVENLVP